MNRIVNNTIRENLSFDCLLGVSIGDAFGDSFFGDEKDVLNCIYHKELPKTNWEFTDDTVMSIAIFKELKKDGDINQDSLIKRFCDYHDLDINRGYGATLRRILREVNAGGDWRKISKNAFDGNGSMGNGAAMRVCPIGAYYFDDHSKVKELAIKSAEITHSNIEAITGAIAVALGTALATQAKNDQEYLNPVEFLERIVSSLPDSTTKSKLFRSLSVPYDYHIETVKKILGNGTEMTSQDTVPFVLWCAAHNLQNFEEALWKAVSILGDRDTICAMVGGITIMSSDESRIPNEWKNSVEKIKESLFYIQ